MPTIGSARCPAGRLSQGRVHLGQDGPKWRINGNGVSQDRRFSLPEDNIRHVYYRSSSNTRGVDGTSCGAGAWIPSSFESCPATGLQLRTDSGKLQIRSSKRGATRWTPIHQKTCCRTRPKNTDRTPSDEDFQPGNTQRATPAIHSSVGVCWILFRGNGMSISQASDLREVSVCFGAGGLQGIRLSMSSNPIGIPNSEKDNDPHMR